MIASPYAWTCAESSDVRPRAFSSSRTTGLAVARIALPVSASASRASSTKSAIFVFCGESGTFASSRFVPSSPMIEKSWPRTRPLPPWSSRSTYFRSAWMNAFCSLRLRL